MVLDVLDVIQHCHCQGRSLFDFTELSGWYLCLIRLRGWSSTLDRVRLVNSLQLMEEGREMGREDRGGRRGRREWGRERDRGRGGKLSLDMWRQLISHESNIYAWRVILEVATLDANLYYPTCAHSLQIFSWKCRTSVLSMCIACNLDSFYRASFQHSLLECTSTIQAVYKQCTSSILVLQNNTSKLHKSLPAHWGQVTDRFWQQSHHASVISNASRHHCLHTHSRHYCLYTIAILLVYHRIFL